MNLEQKIFPPDHLAVKAHSIIVLAHAWAVRRWALKEVASIEEYSAILKPLIFGMLTAGCRDNPEKNSSSGMPGNRQRVA
jgi:hypothetical protein